MFHNHFISFHFGRSHAFILGTQPHLLFLLLFRTPHGHINVGPDVRTNDIHRRDRTEVRSPAEQFNAPGEKNSRQ